MAAIYVNLFTLFSEFGIGTAVVTLQEMTEDQVSQLNTVSVLTGLLGFFIPAAAAVPLGKFFRAPDLPLVVVVLVAVSLFPEYGRILAHSSRKNCGLSFWR